MDPELDFGCVPASSQVICKHHQITNQGSAPGMFHVQYSGDPSVTLTPCSGVIAPGGTQWLKVELRTDRPRLISENALVKLQHGPPLLIKIKAEVVDQCLEVVDVQGSPLSSLWFGPVYFGTSRLKTVVLRNSSPQACDWVCRLTDDAAGTEMGTDLMKSTDTALLERMQSCNSATQDVSQVLACFPKHGKLGPYSETTVAVCFSPKCKRTGKKTKHSSAALQDYCLFLLFESVGGKHGFTYRNDVSSVELAVTGTGLPVCLLPRPSPRFDFLTCATGQCKDLVCVLQNLCPQLPVHFRFHKLAHFTTKPSSGTIGPGQSLDVVLSFTARQQGRFQMRQKIDVLGHVLLKNGSTTEDFTGLELRSFQTITLHLSAVCCIETTHPKPQLNLGITPAVTNPTGSQPLVRSSELGHCRGMVRAAVLSADKTRLHMHRSGQRRSEDAQEFVSFPNDRASSIRPGSANTQYRTIFTGVRRYNYVDPSYAYTDEEEMQRQQHQQFYADFIKQLRKKRLQKIKERQQREKDDGVDLNIVPAQGLVPPELCFSDLESSEASETSPKYNYSTPATKPSRSDETSCTQQVSDVFKAVPSTSQEMADCNRTLTAQELYQVDIGPLFVDFGEVCVQSVCVQELELINHLSVFVWVQLEVDCPELQGSSPLSHVLPPHSHNTLHLMFQSNQLGPFYRSVSYSMNQQHPGQILVQAQVVPFALELSTTRLVLHPTATLLAHSGYRSSVTLRNRHNHAAEFTWRPVVTERGILFSIRPASGTVEPYSDLDCEVVWHPSFYAPLEGDFDLCVHEGNTQRLHCVAKVRPTSVQLAEEQITFRSVPLNMSSVRTAVLHNTGQSHAYFQVVDVHPLPGMVVSPPEGVVPSRGQTTLRIHFTPDSVSRFDTRVKIALRCMKSIELRVGGSVEPPNVEISVSHFQFLGVHTGSKQVRPFSLTNCSSATALVTFDLSEHTDFSVQLPQPSAKTKKGVSLVEIQAKQSVVCSLVFSPTEVASYDFNLPLMVNGEMWPSASWSYSPPPSFSSSNSSVTASGSRKSIISPQSDTRTTQQSQQIQATALCAPLEMSPSSLQFHIGNLSTQCDTSTQTVQLHAVSKDNMFWQSGVKEHVYWWFDCSAQTSSKDDHTERCPCAVSPSSGSLGPGQSVSLAVSVIPEALRAASERVTTLSLPLYLGDAAEGKGCQPYRELHISVTLHLPSITFHPPQILLTPVPLENSATATLTLLASGYPSGGSVTAEVGDVQLEDGTEMQPAAVIFPEGNNIPAQEQTQNQETSLMCTVSFHSAVPLSICTNITFTDHLHNRFKVKLCATADSCVLTVWPFMALHRSEQQIVLKTGPTALQAILQQTLSPAPAPGPTSSSSSLFDYSSSANKSSASDFFSGTYSTSDQTNTTTDTSTKQDSQASLGFPESPAPNSEGEMYFQSVVLAVERWFSFFGWPSGPHPISVPHTLRRVVTSSQANPSSRRPFRVSQNKDCRSVVSMLHHLTGRQIPGIPHFQMFSSDIDHRTSHLLQQHEAMLAFLRVQGACICHIRPEYLLDTMEFRHWCSLQSNEEDGSLDYSSVDYESMSKRSWTDVLLQIYKVLVLNRLPESSANTSLNHRDSDKSLPFSSQPLASNVYSSQELQLLSWLNMHYEKMRKTVWSKGSVPSARWIVNFDLNLTDGLVLAALLAAYCPYLVCCHFQRMYTTTSSLEQIFHNNIILSQALTALCLNLDIQPTDLSDPNPVQMLMLCVHLYERLPQYLPLRTVTLSGGLHSTFSKTVRLKSPSSDHIKYQALLFGKDAHLFSLPHGSTVTIPPKESADLTIQFSCWFLQPMEAFLLLISGCSSGLRSSTLAFSLQTHVSHIQPTKTVVCKSPCYQLKVLQVPLSNPFDKKAKFRVILVESPFNPLEPERTDDSLSHRASSKANMEPITSDKNSGEELEGKSSDPSEEDKEFLSAVRSVSLEPGQARTLNIHYLPFWPGTKYCSVLLVCPQVGDMVYVVQATADLPHPSPLTTKPSSSVVYIPDNSVRLRCSVGQVCEEVLHVPLINMAFEQALAVWGHHCMSADEQRRRKLTHTLHSSTVRATIAARKLLRQRAPWQKDDQHSKEIKYDVEVSLPQYFTLPQTVMIPVKEETDLSWENPADCSCVDVPLRFQADSVGEFKCKVVLRSWCDTRVYMLEALVTSQERTIHLDFCSPAHRSVTQDIPLHNESHQDWRINAQVSGEGFFGPVVMSVPAGTRASYPLTFHPSTQCIVTGRLSLHNDFDGREHVFTLKGVGEHPLPVDHVVLHCPVGQTTQAQLDVPNCSQKNIMIQVVTDLSIVSGPPSLEIKPRDSATYTLSVSPWKRGKQTGFLTFLEIDDNKKTNTHQGNVFEPYKVYFSLEVICEPAAPIRVIDVQCVAQSSVTIEMPVRNPQGDLLTLDVFLDGDGLSGSNMVSIPPGGTLNYKATFSPGRVGKSTGSVLFQSELVGEFWYQLDLYALPPPVIALPQTCCQLGKWTRETIPLVNPTDEALELHVAISNPRNYTLEIDPGSKLIVEPHSSAQLGVRFTPSSIGEGNHMAKITFTCPEMGEWCVFLSGRGLNPEMEESLSISSLIGSSASITIPFINPTEFPLELDITLRDEDPNNHQTPTDSRLFSIPLSRTKGVEVSEGDTFSVPVVFVPNSMELQQAWLCITAKPISSTDSKRSEQELSAICWIYPLRGIPVEGSVENTPLGVIQCEAGCQLEKKVDVLLTGYVQGNQDRKGRDVSQVLTEDFLCKVHPDNEAEQSEAVDCCSVSVEAAQKDPDTGITTLTLNVVYAPLRRHRCPAVLTVQCVSGGIWEFPLTLIATEPEVDDVIIIEATELGKTSAVGFRLTSTTRWPGPFTAAFLPGSSCDFTVTPASGMLPPVGSSGALFTVSFTPTTCSKHRARLTIKALDNQWTYMVKGKALSPPLCAASTADSSSSLRVVSERTPNFVVRNLRVPALANSSPLKANK
ncbi:uncharacterized protein V6R79_025810 [Siganus canaliculatus]